jgi:hypothetical protein
MNFVTGVAADKFGRRNAIILGWIFGLPMPFMVIYASDWWSVAFSSLFLGIQQVKLWSARRPHAFYSARRDFFCFRPRRRGRDKKMCAHSNVAQLDSFSRLLLPPLPILHPLVLDPTRRLSCGRAPSSS